MTRLFFGNNKSWIQLFWSFLFLALPSCTTVILTPDYTISNFPYQYMFSVEDAPKGWIKGDYSRINQMPGLVDGRNGDISSSILKDSMTDSEKMSISFIDPELAIFSDELAAKAVYQKWLNYGHGFGGGQKPILGLHFSPIDPDDQFHLECSSDSVISSGNTFYMFTCFFLQQHGIYLSYIDASLKGQYMKTSFFEEVIHLADERLQSAPMQPQLNPTSAFALTKEMANLSTSGRVVFESNRNGSYQLYSVRPDGSDLHQLTADNGDNQMPAVSPNGRWLAYVKSLSQKKDIYILNLNTGKVTQMTQGSGDNIEPNWSADGKSFLFASNRAGNFDIYRMVIDSLTIQKLTKEPEDETKPVASPNGKQMAYVAQNGIKTSIFVMDLNGANLQKLISPKTDSETDPAWSPDGNWIAYTGFTEQLSKIFISHPNGTESSIIGALMGHHPSWSLDGTHIAYSYQNDTGNNEIVMTTRDGNKTEPIATGPASEEYPQWANLP